jgi:hypothetical protein
MKINRLWNKPVPAAYLFTAMVTLIAYPLLFLVVSGPHKAHPMTAGMAAGVIGGLANWIRIRYLDSLNRRVNADNGIVWDVEVNSVKVGTISDADYAVLRASAFSDGRNYVSQLLNVAKAAVVSVDKMFVAIPLALFWGLSALAVFAPDQFSDVLAAVQKAGPAGIAAAVKSSLQLAISFWLVAIFLNVIFGARLGLVNCFEQDIAKKLRIRCGAAADGSVTVLRWVDGVPTFNDEMSFARGKERSKKSIT